MLSVTETVIYTFVWALVIFYNCARTDECINKKLSYCKWIASAEWQDGRSATININEHHVISVRWILSHHYGTLSAQAESSMLHSSSTPL